MSVNKVILIGRLGKDPEVRYMTNGEAVANFSMATSERWKDKSGEQQEKNEWHNCVVYRRLAEVVGEYLKKGSQIYIEGKLQTRKWQTKEGQDRYTTEIVVDQMQMLGGKGEQQEKRADSSSAPARRSATQEPSKAQTGGGAFSDFDDGEIPF